MKTIRWKTRTLVACGCAIAAQAFGLGADYPNCEPVGGSSAWPQGLKELVNTTNRVHGFFVNAEDIFFFSGSATNLGNFLSDYAKLQGIEKHRLVLHEGAGEAKSPWSTNSKSCDWKLYACPKSWLVAGKMSLARTNSTEAIQQAAKDTNFVSEVHFWMGGKISFDQVAVPKNVELAGDYLKVFQSITNGMTRAEVEREFTLDGGLQSASPVRLIHPGCPNFKVNVEFDFKRNAADQNRAVIGKDDKVIRVSSPYFQRPFMD